MNWKEDLMWLSPSTHKRVLMGILGDAVRAKVAKKSSDFLKTTQREEPGFQSRLSTRQFRRLRPYALSPVNFYRYGLGISWGIVAADAFTESLDVNKWCQSMGLNVTLLTFCSFILEGVFKRPATLHEI